jgi:ribosome biogenesis GTPase / thiamine phosphate phosphatase
MVTRGRDFDEDDIRVRANPRGSRPRSRLRPEHEDAAEGMVIAVDRGRYTCLIEASSDDKRKKGAARRSSREVTAMKARELGRKGVVVGDRVALVGDLRGGPDSLARVVRVHPRTHVLRRTADDTDAVERVLVANADQLVIVTALADPEPRPRMIDRCLVAAFEARLTPILCLTKADLADPAALVAAYEPLGVTVIVTRRDGDLDALRRVLAGRISVLVGHSGVGKSTLVNVLVPDADRAIGVVNDVTGRGRHTSTSAVALRLPEAPLSTLAPVSTPASATSDQVVVDDSATGWLPEGWVIDTPGVRSFGLAHVSPDAVITAFPDLAEVVAQCPRGCTHAADAPDCALDTWLADQAAHAAGDTAAEAAAHAVNVARVDSIRRVLDALTERPDHPAE